MDEQIAALTELAFEQGHIYGARPHTATKTLTVGGKRRIRIRLQADICSAIMVPGGRGWWHYPDLSTDILEAVDELRERQRAL